MIASLFSARALYFTKVLFLILREQETNPVVILFDKRLFLWYNKVKNRGTSFFFVRKIAE